MIIIWYICSYSLKKSSDKTTNESCAHISCANNRQNRKWKNNIRIKEINERNTRRNKKGNEDRKEIIKEIIKEAESL